MLKQTTAFESVELSEFFGEDYDLEVADNDGIVIFTEKQKVMINDLKQKITEINPVHLEPLNKRLSDLETLATAIASFPSLLERTRLTSGTRTPQELIESLINSKKEGDTILLLPSKATLGKGFLVAKLHTFSSLTKLVKEAGLDDKIAQKFREETASMMFLLLSEDVYLNLIKDESLSLDSRRQLATSLLLLWEHRADQNISDISPVLQSVWLARRRLAPAFGTMMGTSELIMISFQLDDIWNKFIKAKLNDPDVNMAMEEFLFGISYENITKLKSMLREQGIATIGRDEVSKFLGESVKVDVSEDYRDFYTQYSVRRDNARARKRLNIAGPRKTLEDYFICFVMEENSKKQRKDAVVE